MTPVVSISLSILAGFALGLGVPSFAARLNEAESGGGPRHSSRRAAESARGWENPRLGAGERMAAFIERAAGLSPDEWPAFFKAQRNSPEWSRLAAQLWAESDPAGFWNFLRAETDRSQLQRWGNGLLQTWAAEDPDAAMDAVMGVTDKNSGDWMRRLVIDTALTGDLSKGLDLAAKAGDFNRFSWGPRPWIDKDPEAAARGLAALPQISKYRDFLKYALEAWAANDPRAALEWMKTENPRRNEAPRRNDEWMSEGFKAAAKKDLQAALAIALNLPDARQRDPAIAGVLASGAVAATDFQELLDLCSPYMQARILSTAFDSLPKTTPAELAIAAGIVTHAPASKASLNATRSLASDWARQDWDGGWHWVESLPDLAMRRAAIQALAESSSAAQGDALASQVSQLPIHELSNNLFKSILTRMPEDQREAWIRKLPTDRADWARAATP